MNLIEQLGGYNEAKNVLEQIKAKPHDVYAQKFERPELERAMLQYRREHNIFELGDKVVIRDGGSNSLFTLKEIKGDFLGDHAVMVDAKSEEWYSGVKYLRHATDEEIAAGHRIDRQIETSSPDEENEIKIMIGLGIIGEFEK